MRIRTIKPQFWQDEELAEVSAEGCLLAVGLLNFADDEGYFRFIPKLIESAVFPLRALSVSMHGMLTELLDIGFISVHEGSDGKQYGRVNSFLKHQRVNRPSASEIAPLVKAAATSVCNHGARSEGSLLERKGTEENKERKVEEAAAAASVPQRPLAEMVARVVQAYPKQSHFRESHESVEAAIARNAKRKGICPQVSADEILAGTEAIAAKLCEWSIAERNRFAPTPPNFFNGDRWADAPECFESRQGDQLQTKGEPPPLGGRKARKVTDLRQS